MRYFINHLAASGRQHGPIANFGVGAKVAAGLRNPEGLEYRSWHGGHGALIRSCRHRDGRWGLDPQAWPDGRPDFWRPLAEQDKAWPLRGRAHGIEVVLLGTTPGHDTTKAPDGVTEARAHRITRYLNTRLLRLPARIEVLVREQSARRNPGPRPRALPAARARRRPRRGRGRARALFRARSDHAGDQAASDRGGRDR